MNDAYGSDCEYKCGHCFNNASCDTTDGTCLNGCEKGYTGSDCKQRKCFKTFYIALSDVYTCKTILKHRISLIFYWSVVHVGFTTLVW